LYSILLWKYTLDVVAGTHLKYLDQGMAEKYDSSYCHNLYDSLTFDIEWVIEISTYSWDLVLAIMPGLQMLNFLICKDFRLIGSHRTILIVEMPHTLSRVLELVDMTKTQWPRMQTAHRYKTTSF
jgi:hypothetical protein